MRLAHTNRLSLINEEVMEGVALKCRRDKLGSVAHAGIPIKLNKEFREVLTQLLPLRRGDRRV